MSKLSDRIVFEVENLLSGNQKSIHFIMDVLNCPDPDLIPALEKLKEVVEIRVIQDNFYGPYVTVHVELTRYD